MARPGLSQVAEAFKKSQRVPEHSDGATLPAGTVSGHLSLDLSSQRVPEHSDGATGYNRSNWRPPYVTTSA